MTSSPAYTFAELGPERQEELSDLWHWAFVPPIASAEEDPPHYPVPWDRTRAIVAGDRIVAAHTSYLVPDFVVPGARTPAAGLAGVAVHPGHRRRGLARRMLETHLADCRERGEAISALGASEPAIYGRYGYGMAADCLSLRIPRDAPLRDVPGAADVEVEIDRVDPARHLPLIQDLDATCTRPGWAPRPRVEPPGHLADPVWARDGFERLCIAVARRGQAVCGWAVFRRRIQWRETGPAGTVQVGELYTADAAAARALWGVLTTMDLTARTEVYLLPVDDPVTRLLVDLRACAPQRSDRLWLRLVDVPAALAARRYPCEVDVVLGVRDELCPDNARAWHLVGGPQGARAEPTTRPVDLSLNVADLAAAYLGGTSLGALAAAGLVVAERPDTLVRASTAFSWPLAPATGWDF